VVVQRGLFTVTFIWAQKVVPRTFSAASAAKPKRISSCLRCCHEKLDEFVFYLSARFCLIIVRGVGEVKRRSCDDHSFGIMDANLRMTAEQNG
jgi:hypothetical protein